MSYGLVKQVYALLEEARMILWPKMLDDPEIPEEGFFPAQEQKTKDDKKIRIMKIPFIEVENGETVKVTVHEILPRYKELVKQELLRKIWTVVVTRIAERINRKFESLHVIIVVYLPSVYRLEVDERPYTVIAKGLKKLLLKEETDNLAVTVLGAYDRENPRTEIYLQEIPYDTAWWPVKKGGADID